MSTGLVQPDRNNVKNMAVLHAFYLFSLLLCSSSRLGWIS